MKDIVISLCDLTGVAVRPWAAAGYECFIFDMQHTGAIEIVGDGVIHKIPGRIDENLGFISYLFATRKVRFVFGFPPCTDTAVSGARHFELKKNNDQLFQGRAMQLFMLCYNIGIESGAPFIIENPVSVVSSFFRKPNYSFHPWEYGALLPDDDINPVSNLIPSRDAYPKKTCLWTGNQYEMPERCPVDKPDGYSEQYKKLGGKSLKTKNIRSATPRGFALAIFNKYGALDA